MNAKRCGVGPPGHRRLPAQLDLELRALDTHLDLEREGDLVRNVDPVADAVPHERDLVVA
jgi:hypothetical protein